MKNENKENYGRVQIRASVCSLNQTALGIMSQRDSVSIGRIIDEALLSNPKFLEYREEVKKLYGY